MGSCGLFEGFYRLGKLLLSGHKNFGSMVKPHKLMDQKHAIIDFLNGTVYSLDKLTFKGC